jgi:putative membrane protein (TIGR04086 family)
MQEKEKSGFISSVIKGVLTALIVTLVGILIFALVIRFTLLSAGVIKSVNQFIKILSVFLASTFFVRGKAGLIKGAFIGGISTILTYLLFSLFGVDISFGATFFLEVLFGVIAGGISGIIAINFKRR